MIVQIILKTITMIITMTILYQVKNEKSSLELQMEACKAEIKMADMERPMQQVDHADADDHHAKDHAQGAGG